MGLTQGPKPRVQLQRRPNQRRELVQHLPQHPQAAKLKPPHHSRRQSSRRSGAPCAANSLAKSAAAARHAAKRA
eukprot:121399-Pyramimonas_sp.AAC.2